MQVQEEKSKMKPLTCIHCSSDYNEANSFDRCSDCRKEIDPYFQMSFELIIVDLILGKSTAYRHILMNRFRRGNNGLALKLALAFIIAEWSYKIRLAFHPPDESAQLTNDANNSTSIFNESDSSDLLYQNGSLIPKKSLELQAILQNIVGGLPQNYQETMYTVVLQFLITFIATMILTKIIYNNAFSKRKISLKQVILAVALSQAARIALFIYSVWRDFNGLCFQVIAMYSYFLLIVGLKGLFENKHFILPLIIVVLVFTIKSAVFAMIFNQPLSLEVNKTDDL